MTLEGSEAAEDLLQRAADTLLKFVTLRSHESLVSFGQSSFSLFSALLNLNSSVLSLFFF